MLVKAVKNTVSQESVVGSFKKKTIVSNMPISVMYKGLLL